MLRSITLTMTDRISLLIEDPVEYRFKSINQVQVNPRAGLTFANGLRSILRLDPNVILVGEIRDAVTIALDSLERQGSEVNQNLRVITNILPSTISLTGISYAGDKLTVSGRSPSQTEVFSYAESLSAKQVFRGYYCQHKEN